MLIVRHLTVVQGEEAEAEAGEAKQTQLAALAVEAQWASTAVAAAAVVAAGSAEGELVFGIAVGKEGFDLLPSNLQGREQSALARVEAEKILMVAL